MRCTNDQAAILIEKFIGLPIQGVADMHAEILVGENLTAATHNEPLEWPVAIADTKFTASRVVEVVQMDAHGESEFEIEIEH